MRRFLRPNWFIGLWTLLLCATLAWTFLAEAQTTNEPSGTNGPVNRLAALEQVSSGIIKDNASILTFGLDTIPEFQGRLFGRPYWQYVASGIYLLVALVLSKVVDWLFQNRLRKWTEKTESDWDDIVVRLMDGPIKVIVFVIFLNIGLQLFEWPGWIEHWLTRLTIIAVGISVVMVVLRAVDALVTVWRRRLPEGGDRSFNEQFVVLIGKVLKGAIFVVATFTVLSHLGLDIRTALASVSVLGLALGLAAQDTVGNLFGAVAVFMDKPFKIGDRVKMGEVDGNIEEMGIRSTRVRSLEGFLITVPNKNVGNATIINITARPTIRANLAIGVTYNTSTAKVKRATQLLEEIFRGHPKTADVIVHFNKFADSSLNLDVLYWCKTTDWKEFCATIQELNFTIKERFDAEGIEFAFPTRTLYLRQEANWQTPPDGQPAPTTR